MSEVQTKYEILKAYQIASHPEYIRDTWLGLGGAVISSTSRTYIKDMVYRVDLATSSGDVPEGAILQGALILCEASLYNSNPLDWSAVTVEDEDQGYVSFILGIISPHFRVLLTSAEVEAITVAPDPTFVPYSETLTATIIIPDQELETILVEVGVPFVLLEELEFPRNKICNDIIQPAMQEYFKYFPIIRRETKYNSVAQAGQVFSIPLPEGAYGAVRVYVSQGTTNEAGAAAGNPMHFFASEIAWWGGGSNNNWSPTRYGSGRSPGFSNLQGFGTMALDRAARQGILNYATRAEFHIERQGDQKMLVGYANRTGTLEIHWALASNDWSDVEYTRMPELRKLCTARVLRALGMLRGQVRSDIPGAINFDMFINRAKELEEEVLGFWKEIPKIAVIRG
jgi:hypothetical protein